MTDPTGAPLPPPAVIQQGLDVIQYVQAAGPLGVLIVLAFLWRQSVQPFFDRLLDRQSEAFDKALRSAEDRAEKDRAAHEKATREGMRAMGDTVARAVTDSLRQSTQEITQQVGRMDVHLQHLAQGGGCLAGAGSPAPAQPHRRAPSQPPIPMSGFGRRLGPSPFSLVELEEAAEHREEARHG